MQLGQNHLIFELKLLRSAPVMAAGSWEEPCCGLSQIVFWDVPRNLIWYQMCLPVATVESSMKTLLLYRRMRAGGDMVMLKKNRRMMHFHGDTDSVVGMKSASRSRATMKRCKVSSSFMTYTSHSEVHVNVWSSKWCRQNAVLLDGEKFF